LADVLEAPFAGAAATRLTDLRATVTEDRYDAELRLGRHAEALAGIEAASAERPLSERLAGLRMRALSATGRQSDALAVYEGIRARLAEDLGVDPSGQLTETHLALLRGELDQPVTPSEGGSGRSRLPAQLTSFVGREPELDQLARHLTTSRLVTIVGPGGAGKTRLSLEAAARDRAYRRGRVWFVSLAAVDEANQLADAVLGTLGRANGRPESVHSSDTAALDRIADVLDVGDALLVVDNCEHLIDGAATLAAQLLDRLPELRVLATSREPLAIIGETLCHLGPLGMPAGAPDAAEAARAAAVRLFVDRAAGVRPGFTLDDSTVDQVVEICARLDGMPLALELAAAKLRTMTVEQVAQRLDDRFRLLTSGSRTALPRQRTLLAVVEWSWDLLTEAERVLARRLSAFPAGASAAAVDAVCASGSLAAADVPYLLGCLIEKSLVQLTVGAAPRYRMLETVRAYAAAQLVAAGDNVSGRFADYFLGLAEKHEPLLRTRDQLQAIAVFDTEHDNIVSALRTVLNAGDAVTAARFVRAMFWYWGIRGMTTQFDTFLTEVLQFGDALPDDARAAFNAARLPSAKPAAELAASREAAGAAGSGSADIFHPAVPLLRTSALASTAGESADGQIRQALDSPDPWVRASAHWALDFLFTQQGDLRTGEPHRAEALRGFEAVGDRWGLVVSWMNVGRDHSWRAEHTQAIAAFERAVAIAAELGTEDLLFAVRPRLAQERMRSGDLDGALRDVHAAIRHAKERGLRRIATQQLSTLADVHRVAGEYVLADQALDRLAERVEDLPYPVDLARDTLQGMRMAVRVAAGDDAAARALLPRAARGYLGRGDTNGMRWPLQLLAKLLELEGDAANAATTLGRVGNWRGGTVRR
jgi:predicted ATPase